jgi:hypothetical protein
MKSILMRAGFITCLMLICWTYEEAFAESTWTSKCSSFGEIKPNQNPTLHHMNCLLTNAALEAKIPPEVVKAVVSEENGGWKQFDDNGQPVISDDNGFGLMQITNQPSYDQEKLKYDIIYNIQAGVEILSSMYYHRTDLPKIIETGPEVIENWYFPVMAYNGTKPSNSPLYQSSGLKNINAYQEEVFAYIEKDSYLNDTKLGQFPFSTAHFEYDPNSRENIVFKNMEYTLTEQMHASAYHFQMGDKVSVTEDTVNLRSQPSSQNSISSVVKALAINTTLTIEGNFLYEQYLESENKFVWYPVKTDDQKLAGYISSAYITKKLDVPVIDPLDDNDVFLSGKAPANVTIQIMNGTELIGSSVADTNGYFKSDISAQKAGAQLIVFYKDKLNALSPSKTITVSDKTAPLAPSVNMVNNKAAKATGKTEAYATVTVTIIGKAYSKKADASGNYEVAIPVQKASTSISVTAKDKVGNVSAARTTKVTKVAPDMPTVNPVKSSSTTVTGKSEKGAIVTVKIGTKVYTANANAAGDYKVYIPKQKAKIKLYVNAKDTKRQVSATRTITVSQ